MDRNTFKKRLDRCCTLMKDAGLDALLLTKPANMFYLTGDGRLCAFAMITRGGRVALGVPRTDVEDAGWFAHFDHITGFDDEVGMVHAIAHYFKEFGVTQGSLGLEYSFLTQSMMTMLTHPHAKPDGVTPTDCTPLMSALRIVKDDCEIDLIRHAAKVADAGMAAAVNAVKPGVTESAVAAEAERAMRLEGADGFWKTYVSAGERTGIAHGLPTQRKITPGDLVMIDLHPVVNAYSADLCRTVCEGSSSVEQEKAYEVYLDAQQAAIEKIKAGVAVKDIEETFRGMLNMAGHGEHLFGPLIHGVGIEFEEAPLPAGHAFFHGEKAPEALKENTVIAVGNCGLYLGSWGVRVEDTVVVTRDGHMVLTNFPRQLLLEL